MQIQQYPERETIMEFNEKLQQLRKQRKITQEELARAIYVSRTAVSKWESGRGYPNIDSLKTIAKFFGVTIDDLLSGGEAIPVAEAERRAGEAQLTRRVFALLDLSAALLLFLPLFADRSGRGIRAVGLFGLGAGWLRIACFGLAAGMIATGALILALQKRGGCRLRRISIGLNALGTVLFIAGSQPYAAVYLLALLMIKGFLAAKTR